MTVTIDRLRLFLIESPIRMTRAQGVGTVSGTIKRVIVELTASDGVTGWGEAAPWEVFTGTAEGAFAALDVYLRPVLIGADAMRPRAILTLLDRRLTGHPDAKAAVDMALLDAMGRRAGLSVADLLGGRVRDTIALSFSIADPDFSADLARMEAMVAGGHRLFKVKTGVRPHAEDMAHLEAIRATFARRVDLRVDYNQALSPFDALRVLRDVEQFRPTFIEQPVARPHLSCMAGLAAALDTPILADESVFDIHDLRAAIEARAADAVSVKLMKTGGMLKAQALMALADAAGWPGYGGTLWEGGLALAAGTQFIAAMPGVSLGCEFYMPSHVLTADILEVPVGNRGGEVIVPHGPGLGVRVSEASVRDGARVIAEA